MNDKRAFLIILDGWGHGPNPEVSAIAQAKTPFMDSLYRDYPNAELITYGEQVGLPEGQMGNSEVGHLNIGAGRVVYQELARINKAVKDGELQQNPILQEAFEYAGKHHKSVHFMGLVSDGGVHSHSNHLLALTDMATDQGLKNIFIHAFTDGRDTDPKGGLGYLKEVLDHIEDQPTQLASVIGRYYAMDRDKRWERIKLAYDLLVKGEGEKATDVLSAMKKQYDQDVTDEFLKPIVAVNQANEPIATIEEGDVVIFFNFRTDRPRQLTTVLTQQSFEDYDMQPLKLHYVTMTRYDETFKGIKVVFEKEDVDGTLGEVLSKIGKTQVRIAETEKYPHVTFFFNGGREEPFEEEKRILIPSPKVATYDLQPEMSAIEITDAIIQEIEANMPDFICLNYANTDMVGHTGVFEAAMKAAETVDQCLERLLKIASAHDYGVIIIADHGNSDYMINKDGTPNTAHTKNPVPCIYVGADAADYKVENGKLADVAPTLLTILGIDQPGNMTGHSLLINKKSAVKSA